MAVPVSFQVSHRQFLRFEKTGKMMLEVKHLVILIDPKNRRVGIMDAKTGATLPAFLMDRHNAHPEKELVCKYEFSRPY